MEVVFGEEPVLSCLERMPGRLRQVRGRDEGLELPLPTSFPECHAPFWVGLQSIRSRCQQFSAVWKGAKGTLATDC